MTVTIDTSSGIKNCEIIDELMVYLKHYVMPAKTH